MIRANEGYLNCPNSDCGNYGFIEDLCCPNQIECTECEAKWKLKCQPSLGFNLRKYLSLEAIYDTNTYSNLYKVLFA